MAEMQDKIVFFDGVCNFCNASVDLLFRKNKKKNLRYAALQSDFAKKLLAENSIDTKETDSIIYYAGGKFYFRSSAVLQLSKELSGIYRLLPVFYIVPRFIRDGIYKWIAKNRYKWFGKKETCRIPTKEEQKYFFN